MGILIFVFFVLSVGTPHHVRCFTHLFCTFIGGKFEVSDWMAKSVSNR